MTADDVVPLTDAIVADHWGERRSWFEFVVGHPACRPLVAEDGDGRQLGSAVATVNGPVAWIGTIWVVPDRRREGIGERLTEAVLDVAGDAGCRTSVLVATDVGRPLYEKLGFEVQTSIVVVEAPGTGADASGVAAGGAGRSAGPPVPPRRPRGDGPPRPRRDRRGPAPPAARVRDPGVGHASSTTRPRDRRLRGPGAMGRRRDHRPGPGRRAGAPRGPAAPDRPGPPCPRRRPRRERVGARAPRPTRAGPRHGGRRASSGEPRSPGSPRPSGASSTTPSARCGADAPDSWLTLAPSMG